MHVLELNCHAGVTQLHCTVYMHVHNNFFVTKILFSIIINFYTNFHKNYIS